MTAHRRVTRRVALGALIGAAVLLASVRRPLPAVPGDRWAAAARRLRRLVPAQASARRIGLAYAARHPDEADTGIALRRLLSSLSLVPDDVMAQEEAALRRILTSRLRDDFANGGTVTLDGWILSRTEARLCLIIA